jgi:hypothetical protein
MENIKVTSSLDLKTYFNASLLVAFKLRTILMVIAFVAIISYMELNGQTFQWWFGIVLVLGLTVGYSGLIILLIYIGCRRNIKNVAYLREKNHYSINSEKIEYKNDSASASSNWQYIKKLIEREKYFMLMASARSFHYLPKDGFESADDITRFKNIVREKGIKMTYH